MTDKNSEPALTITGMFQAPGTRNYLIVAFASLLVYFLLLSARGSETGALIALLLAVPGLLARWTVSPVAVLLLSTYLLIDPNFAGLIEVLEGYGGVGSGYARRGAGTRLDAAAVIEDVLLAAALMGYLMAQYRLRSLVGRSLPEETRARRAKEPAPAPVIRPASSVSDDEVGSMLVAGGACVVAGLVTWWVLLGLEMGLGVSRGLEIERVWGRVLVFVWLFGVGMLVAWAVLSYRSWVRMRPEEARLVMQDTFWGETRREVERMTRWRVWFRVRRRRITGGRQR